MGNQEDMHLLNLKKKKKEILQKNMLMEEKLMADVFCATEKEVDCLDLGCQKD